MTVRTSQCVAAACAVFVVGCRGTSTRRILPDLSVVDGVAQAQLSALPTPLDPTFTWTFRAVRSVRTVVKGASEPLVYDPAQVLQLRGGDLLVYDPDADRPLVIMNPASGSVVRRFGRKGRGPGEMNRNVLLAQGDDGSLSVVDGSNRRIHRYTSDGEWLGDDPIDASQPLGPSLSPRPGGGGFLTSGLQMEETGWHRDLLLIDSTGSPVRRLAGLPAPAPASDLPGHIQKGRVLWTVVGNHVVAMWSGRPRVTIYDRDGTRVRVIQLPLTERQLTDREISLRIKQSGGVAGFLRPGPIALTNMLYAVNDSVFGMLLSNLWHAAEDPPLPDEATYWRLFTVRGEYIGTVEQPSDFWVLGRGHGTLWVRVLDDDAQPVIEEVRLEPTAG